MNTGNSLNCKIFMVLHSNTLYSRHLITTFHNALTLSNIMHFAVVFFFVSILTPSSGWAKNVDNTMLPTTSSPPMMNVNPLCSFCLLLMKTLEDMLPKERTEETVVKLLEKICDYLPAHYKDMCDKFIETYGKMIIELLIKSASPKVICAALGLCLPQEPPILMSTVQTDCDSCKILTLLSQFHLGHNATEIQTSDLLQKICKLHPNAIPECEGFVKSHGHRLLKSDGKPPGTTLACQEDYLCREQK